MSQRQRHGKGSCQGRTPINAGVLGCQTLRCGSPGPIECLFGRVPFIYAVFSPLVSNIPFGLFSIERDQALEVDDETSARTRDLLKTLGSVSLGDRYKVQVVYEEGVLAIGSDEGWFQRHEDAIKTLVVHWRVARVATRSAPRLG